MLRLHAYLAARFPFGFHITIADNGSTDRTPAIAARLARELPAVSLLRLEQKGRGRALRAAWSASDAEILCYMDVDLSTDLDALLPLVSPLVSGHSDVAIGSRLARGARVRRGPKRELISRAYNLILHAALSCPPCRTTAGSSTRSCSCWRSGACLPCPEVPVDWTTTRLGGRPSSFPGARRPCAASGLAGRPAMLADRRRRRAPPVACGLLTPPARPSGPLEANAAARSRPRSRTPPQTAG